METLAFDLGRVIFDFDYDIALEKIKHRTIVPKEKIIDDLFCKDFAADFEKGLISTYDFYRKFKKNYIPSIDYNEFVDVWSDIFNPKTQMIDLIERLKPEYPIYMISNINQLHFEHLYKNYPQVFALFRDLILSYKVKSIKPEKEIYENLETIAGKESRDIIYVDDRQELISKARLLNFQCILFSDYERLLKDLDALGIKIPDNH
ncbi:MAG: HAD family phosphatase [Candidatus Omnitrophota bacterium]|nr:MAG: HAD family phosphatase [Candidatus Omnitrophota bacterium]